MRVLDPRLFRYARSSRGLLTVSVALALAIALSTIVQAFILADVIVSVFERELAPRDISSKIMALLLVIFIRAGLQFLTELLSTRLSTRVTSQLRSSLFDALLTTSSRTPLFEKAGSISTLATIGISALTPYFSKFVPQLFIATLVPLLVGIVITYTDLLSGIVVLFTVPLIPLFGILIGKYTEVAVRKKWNSLQTLSNHILDLLSGLLTLKLFGRARAQKSKLEESGEEYRKETISVLKVSFLSSFALELIATLSVALIAVSIGIRLIDGKMNLLTGLTVLILAPEVYWPIRNVASYFHSASDGAAASQEIFDVLARNDESRGRHVANLELTGKVRGLSWTDLSIEYPDRRTIRIPSGGINSGELVALVGASGAGKSSFFANILGFNSASEGVISMINEDRQCHALSDLSISKWRTRCSWVPQTPTFPQGTIRMMFHSIKPYANDSDMWRVLRDSGLRRSELPNGLDSDLGDFLGGLSQGQLRRLAIARSLFKDGDLFLFDEPTASVDDLLEQELISLLKNLRSSGKIVFVISHRPEVIASADKVLKLEYHGATV